jgi:hypothetical protein
MIMFTAADKSYLAKAHPSVDKLDRTGRLGNSSKSSYSYNIDITISVFLLEIAPQQINLHHVKLHN